MTTAGRPYVESIAKAHRLEHASYLSAPILTGEIVPLIGDPKVSARYPDSLVSDPLDRSLKATFEPVHMLYRAIAKQLDETMPIDASSQWDIDGIGVRNAMLPRRSTPRQLGQFTIRLISPGDLTEAQRQATLYAAESCPAVNNSQLAFSLHANHAGEAVACIVGTQLRARTEPPAKLYIAGALI